MPEINPLSNEQIFLKKIAENTGSDYETGDVSEINPITIDQILLKEIAANTAGQSGDITELEGKVADNTSAIEAMVDVYGAKNLLPVTLSNLKANNTNGTWSGNTYTYRDVTYTCTTSGDIVTSITMNGTANSAGDSLISIPMACHAGNWLANGGTADSSLTTYGAFVDISGGVYPYVYDEDVEINLNSDATISYIIYTRTGQTCSNVTFYPMIRDARIKDSTYVPYSMTNRELTDRIKIQQISVTTQIDGTCQLWHKSVMMMPIGFSVVTFPTGANEVNGSFTLSTNDYWYMMMKKSDGSIISEKSAVINIAYLSY